MAPGYDDYCPRHRGQLLFSLGENAETGEEVRYCAICHPEMAAIHDPEAAEAALERLYACLCCQYQTLVEQGAWDLCPVCGWEDGDILMDGLAVIYSSKQTGPGRFQVAYSGQPDLDQVSGCNHLSLRQARANFQSYGACDEHARRCGRLTYRQFRQAMLSGLVGSKWNWEECARQRWPEEAGK